MLFFFFLFVTVPINLVFSQDEQVVDELENEINAFLESTRQWVRPNNSNKYAEGATSELHNGGRFDFIIVGGGSTGTVIANRLSEIKDWNILLLESGGPENNITDIPGMYATLALSDFNWGYQTVPQKRSCQSFPEHRCEYVRGNVLGGCSVVNAMVYSRGDKADWNNWAAQGNPGWSYDEIFPYFLKSEDTSVPNIEPEYHRKGGYLHVESVRYMPQVGEIFLNGSVEAGRKLIDYNGRSTFGSSWIQINTLNGTRFSGARAFIKPVRYRKNLVIRLKALALKLSVDKRNQVNGVYYIQNKKYYLATVSKEVILSAGTMNSPRLLMISGIGPKKQLQSLNITVIKDLAVGQNLRDHILVTGVNYDTSVHVEDMTLKQQVKEYLQGHGNLSAPGGALALSFVKTKSWKGKEPNIEHAMLAVGNVLIIFVIFLHPESRGSVTLRSNNPFDYPNIDLNHYGAKGDLQYVIEGVQSAIELGNTEAFRRYNSTLMFPRANCTQELYSQEFLECVLPFISIAGYHSVGTCKMGPKNDSEAVVDNKLRVYGVKGLRVADCSVFPVLITGHTNVPAVTVGEKASDIIKFHYGRIK